MSSPTRETRAFQTEVRQLLDLMIHSLYGNREVFLRELISNASDAADKLRFEALGDPALYEGDGELKIRITFDKEARTVTVSDNGIGMNRDEVVENIGTIARSGTREFLKQMDPTQKADANLIGQFGVGFYSAFIVADRVTLTTRRGGSGPEHGVRWESAGDGEYSIETVEMPSRGTEITLHLREDASEFLDGWKLRGIVRKFSDHVPWPIEMVKAAGYDAPDDDEDQGEDQGEDGEKKAEENKAEKPPEWEKVNDASALWSRSKSEITAEDYNAFYKHAAHDYQDPLAHVHAHLEGKYDYTVLLYVPQHAPFDLWDRDRKHGVRLYVRRVFIMEGSEELMPRYLRFVRGVIDSADLPLNVSREILQESRVTEVIRKGAVGKVLDLLEQIADKEPEKYETFWKAFGAVMKEGVIEDSANRTKLAKLLRFASTQGEGDQEKVSLADYVGRMKEGQDKIFFVTGENHAAAASSPHLEIFRKKGLEVLLLADRIDEWLVSHLTEFEGKSLQSVARGDLDLGKLEDEAERQAHEQEEKAVGDLPKRIQASLGELVKEVRTTHRLTDSPACLVSGEYDLSPAVERILKAAGQEAPSAKRVLEINPIHPLIVRLKDEVEEERFNEWARVLFDQALLSEGGALADPAGYVRRLNGLLVALAR
ncbi:MAG: molecular chaperone HtpG [Magnetococcales bacterium]|nr:molecular chaperone HtpG [Magnetococcales bacterium]